MKKPLAWAVTTATAAALSLSCVGAGSANAAAAGTPNAPDAFLKSSAAKKADNRAIWERLQKKLPADWEKRRDATRAKFDIDSSPVEQALRSKLAKASAGTTDNAIDPTQYTCGPTRLDAFVDSILADVDPFNLLILSLVGGLDIPTYDALLFGTSKSPDHQLPAGYKKSLTTTFGYTQRFWDVQLNDVSLLAMNGDIFKDVNRVAKVVEFIYEVGPADATDIAKDIIAIVESDPGLEGGDNPIFTLNAFAFSGKGDPDPVIRKIKDKVVFGDGLLAGLKAMNLNSVGPRAVLSHEMAHHVQYEADLFDSDLPAPEATRRTELMADGFGTYFLTHKKGLGMNPTQVLQAAQSFYEVGDCSYDNPGHHGTPNQRKAAANWGAATVAYSNNPNKVLPVLNLSKKFDKALPILVAPDAPSTPAGYRTLVKSAN